MAVAGAVRSSTAVGLRQTAWRVGGVAQRQQVRCIGGVDRATAAREQKKQLRKTSLKQEQDAMGGGNMQNEILIPCKTKS